nr:MAG: replication initiation protein [Microvirus sp.]
MSCFHPLHGYKSPKNGKWISEQNSPLYHKWEPLSIPCNKCTGCRTEYSRQWAMRITHEASLWKLKNTFITLTYNDNWLPTHNTLIKRDFTLFMKRLRKKRKSNKQNPIRFYMCGEYGEKKGRPHYHAILFNCLFKKEDKIGKNLYTSTELQDLWTWTNPKDKDEKESMGYVSHGDVTFQSAAYVANYVQKKINGKKKDEHYKIKNPLDKKTGVYLTHRQQEYAQMSRKPGIAGDWLTKWKDEVYRNDSIHIDGRKMKPPKYYDRQMEILEPQKIAIIKAQRKIEMESLQHLFTPEALKQKEVHHKAKMALHKRNQL